MKFADPKNDIAFKKIFGDEKHKEVLISFLNSVLDFKNEKTILDVTLSNTYQLSQIEELKDTILDIKATNQNNEEFIIEMQKKDIGDFAKRSLYYTSKSYVNQIKKAEQYKELKKVYFIGILDFAIFNTPHYLSRHLILDSKTLNHELKDFEFNYIELKKFNLSLQECDSIAKKWIYFINNASSLDLIPKELENIKEFQIAFQSANTYTWDKKELNYYDRVSLKKGDDKNALITAEKKGIEQGIEQGVKKEKLEIAKNLLIANVDIDIIAQTTKLSIEQIESLIDRRHL